MAKRIKKARTRSIEKVRKNQGKKAATKQVAAKTNLDQKVKSTKSKKAGASVKSTGSAESSINKRHVTKPFVRSGKATPSIASEEQPRFTGRHLVVLNSEASVSSLQKKAKKFSVSMASTSDFSAKSGESVVDKALQQADGIIFEKLKVAVINQDLQENVHGMTSTSAGKDSFIHAEPERFVYATTAKTTKALLAYTDNKVATWGVHVTNVLKATRTGKGVNVAILDTGCDRTHPEFIGRIKGAKSFIPGETPDDGNGHGSHCTGIAAGGIRKDKGYRFGVASDANIYIGKVLSNKGRGQDSSILAGIEWALQNKCRVISMSLGGVVSAGETFYKSYETAATQALKLNCLIVAAAGNESERSLNRIMPVDHPANCPSIMAVGALTGELGIADFSCGGIYDNGGQVDIAGPGTDIISCWSKGKWAIESGTSMATPFVAGMAALLCEAYPKATAHEIWLKLTQTAKRLRLKSSDVGSGLVYFR